MAFDSKSYINQYNKENYHRIAFRIPKRKEKALNELSEKTGKSINSLIIEALEEKYGIDLSTKNN